MHLNMHKTFLSLLHEISNLFLRPSHELCVIVGKAKRKFIAALAVVVVAAVIFGISVQVSARTVMSLIWATEG